MEQKGTATLLNPRWGSFKKQISILSAVFAIVATLVFGFIIFHSLFASASSSPKITNVNIDKIEGNTLTLSVDLENNSVIKKENLQICKVEDLSLERVYNGEVPYTWTSVNTKCGEDDISNFSVEDGNNTKRQILKVGTSGYNYNFLGIRFGAAQYLQDYKICPQTDNGNKCDDGSETYLYKFKLGKLGGVFGPSIGEAKIAFGGANKSSVKISPRSLVVGAKVISGSVTKRDAGGTATPSSIVVTLDFDISTTLAPEDIAFCDAQNVCNSGGNWDYDNMSISPSSGTATTFTITLNALNVNWQGWENVRRIAIKGYFHSCSNVINNKKTNQYNGADGWKDQDVTIFSILDNPTGGSTITNPVYNYDNTPLRSSTYMPLAPSDPPTGLSSPGIDQPTEIISLNWGTSVQDATGNDAVKLRGTSTSDSAPSDEYKYEGKITSTNDKDAAPVTNGTCVVTEASGCTITGINLAAQSTYYVFYRVINIYNGEENNPNGVSGPWSSGASFTTGVQDLGVATAIKGTVSNSQGGTVTVTLNADLANTLTTQPTFTVKYRSTVIPQTVTSYTPSHTFVLTFPNPIIYKGSLAVCLNTAPDPMPAGYVFSQTKCAGFEVNEIEGSEYCNGQTLGNSTDSGYKWCDKIVMANRLQNMLNPDDPNYLDKYGESKDKVDNTVDDTKNWSLIDADGYNGSGISTYCTGPTSSPGSDDGSVMTFPRKDVDKADPCYDTISDFNVSSQSYSNMRVEIASAKENLNGGVTNGISEEYANDDGTVSPGANVPANTRSGAYLGQTGLFGETVYDNASKRWFPVNPNNPFKDIQGKSYSSGSSNLGNSLNLQTTCPASGTACKLNSWRANYGTFDITRGPVVYYNKGFNDSKVPLSRDGNQLYDSGHQSDGNNPTFGISRMYNKQSSSVDIKWPLAITRGYGSDSYLGYINNNGDFTKEVITIYYDNVGIYSTINSPKSYAVAAKVEVSNIRFSAGSEPHLNFSNNLFSGFEYKNIDSFSLKITFYHKYQPSDCVNTTSAVCVYSKHMAGKALNFSNSYFGQKSSELAYGTNTNGDTDPSKSAEAQEAAMKASQDVVFGFFSLNGSGDSSGSGNPVTYNLEGGNERVRHERDDGSPLQDGILSMGPLNKNDPNSTIGINAAVSYKAGTGSTKAQNLGIPGSYVGSWGTQDGDPWGAGYTCDNKAIYCWKDWLPTSSFNETFARSGVSFPGNGTTQNFSFGSDYWYVWSGFNTMSTFPKHQDLPTKTVSHIINQNQTEAGWSAATGIQYDYSNMYGYPKTWQNHSETPTTNYAIPGYEHRNDNDLDRLWALQPTIIKGSGTDDDRFVPSWVYQLGYPAASGVKVFDHTASSQYGMFTEADKPYCLKPDGSQDLTLDEKDVCEATAGNIWVQGLDYESVSVGDALAASNKPNVYNFSKSIVTNWLKQTNNKIDYSTHSSKQIVDATSDPIYPEAKKRLLLQDTIHQGDTYPSCAGTDTWVPSAPQLGANDYYTDKFMNFQTYYPKDTSGNDCINAANRDSASRSQMLNTPTNNDTGAFDYYINQKLINDSEQAFTPKTITITDILPNGVKIMNNSVNSGDSIINAPIVVMGPGKNRMGEAICYYSLNDDRPDTITYNGETVAKCSSVTITQVQVVSSDLPNESYTNVDGTASGSTDLSRTKITIVLGSDELSHIEGNGLVQSFKDEYDNPITIGKELTVRVRAMMTDNAVKWVAANPSKFWERSNAAQVTFVYDGYSDAAGKIANTTNRVVIGAGVPPAENKPMLINVQKVLKAVSGNGSSPLPGASFSLVPSLETGQPLSLTDYCAKYTMFDKPYSGKLPCDSIGNTPTGTVDDLKASFPDATSEPSGYIYFDRNNNMCGNITIGTEPLGCEHVISSSSSGSVGYLPGNLEAPGVGDTENDPQRFYLLKELSAPTGIIKSNNVWVIQLTIQNCQGSGDSGCMIVNEYTPTVATATGAGIVTIEGVKYAKVGTQKLLEAGPERELNNYTLQKQVFTDIPSNDGDNKLTITNYRPYKLDIGKIVGSTDSVSGANVTIGQRIRWDHGWIPNGTSPTASGGACLIPGNNYNPDDNTALGGGSTPANDSKCAAVDYSLAATFKIEQQNVDGSWSPIVGKSAQIPSADGLSLVTNNEDGVFMNQQNYARVDDLLNLSLDPTKTYKITELKAPNGFDAITGYYLLSYGTSGNPQLIYHTSGADVTWNTSINPNNPTTVNNITQANNTIWYQTQNTYCSNYTYNGTASACASAGSIAPGNGTGTSATTFIPNASLNPVVHFNVKNLPTLEYKLKIKKVDPYGKSLNNFVFSLYKADSNANVYLWGSSSTACSGTGNISQDAMVANANNNLSGCNGQFRRTGYTETGGAGPGDEASWSGLSQGYYLLREVSSNNGFPVSNVYYLINITTANSAGVVKMADANGNPTTDVSIATSVPSNMYSVANGNLSYTSATDSNKVETIGPFNIVNDKKFRIDLLKNVTNFTTYLPGAIFQMYDCGEAINTSGNVTITTDTPKNSSGATVTDASCMADTYLKEQFVTGTDGKAYIDANKNGVKDSTETKTMSDLVLSAYHIYIIKETKPPFGYQSTTGYFRVKYVIPATYSESSEFISTTYFSSVGGTSTALNNANGYNYFDCTATSTTANDSRCLTIGYHNAHLNILNTPMLTNLSFLKKDSLNNNLAGAQFKLVKLGTDTATQIGANNLATSTLGQVVGGKILSPTLPASGVDVLTVTSDSNGLVSFPNLADGYYYLYESAPPSGWTQINPKRFLFRIDGSINSNGTKMNSTRWQIETNAGEDILTNPTNLLSDPRVATDLMKVMPTTTPYASNPQYYELALNDDLQYRNQNVFHVKVLKADANDQHVIQGASFTLYACSKSTVSGAPAAVTSSASSVCDSPTAVLSNILTDANGYLPTLDSYIFDANKAYMLVENISAPMYLPHRGFYIIAYHWLATPDATGNYGVSFVVNYPNGTIDRTANPITVTSNGSGTILQGQRDGSNGTGPTDDAYWNQNCSFNGNAPTSNTGTNSETFVTGGANEAADYCYSNSSNAIINTLGILIKNQPYKAKFDFIKYKQTNVGDLPLDGATFNLQKVNIPTTSTLGTATNSGSGWTTYRVINSDQDSEGNITTYPLSAVSQNGGIVTFSGQYGLTGGYYLITETTPPVGYIKSDNRSFLIYIPVSNNNETQAIKVWNVTNTRTSGSDLQISTSIYKAQTYTATTNSQFYNYHLGGTVTGGSDLGAQTVEFFNTLQYKVNLTKYELNTNRTLANYHADIFECPNVASSDGCGIPTSPKTWADYRKTPATTTGSNNSGVVQDFASLTFDSDKNYRIIEKTAPNGYYQNTNYYVLTYDYSLGADNNGRVVVKEYNASGTLIQEIVPGTTPGASWTPAGNPTPEFGLFAFKTEDKPVPSRVVFKKLDSRGYIVSGATFELRQGSVSGTLIDTMTSDNSGNVKMNNGKLINYNCASNATGDCETQYFLLEASAPANYKKSDSVYRITIKTTILNGVVTHADTICLYNTTSSNCGTESPLLGVTTLVTDATQTGSTTETNFRQINLSQLLASSAWGNGFVNTLQYKLKITKRDQQTTSWLLANAKFKFYEITGYDTQANNGLFTAATQIGSEMTTRADGTLLELEQQLLDTSKTYMIIETVAPSGHYLDINHPDYYIIRWVPTGTSGSTVDSGSAQVERWYWSASSTKYVNDSTYTATWLTASQTGGPRLDMNINNPRIPTTFNFYKKASNGSMLQGAVFCMTAVTSDVTGSSVSLYTQPTTSNCQKSATSAATTGKIEFTNVADGYYVLEELTAPNGFRKNTNKYLVIVQSGATTYLKIGLLNSSVTAITGSLLDYTRVEQTSQTGSATSTPPLPAVTTNTNYLADLTLSLNLYDLNNTEFFHVNLTKRAWVVGGATQNGTVLQNAVFRLFVCNNNNDNCASYNNTPLTIGGQTDLTTNNQGKIPALEAYEFDATKTYRLQEITAPLNYTSPSGYWVINYDYGYNNDGHITHYNSSGVLQDNCQTSGTPARCVSDSSGGSYDNGGLGAHSNITESVPTTNNTERFSTLAVDLYNYEKTYQIDIAKFQTTYQKMVGDIDNSSGLKDTIDYQTEPAYGPAPVLNTPRSGVQFTIYQANSTTGAKGAQITNLTSGADGKVSFANLKFTTSQCYRIAETSTPQNNIVNNTEYVFCIGTHSNGVPYLEYWKTTSGSNPSPNLASASGKVTVDVGTVQGHDLIRTVDSTIPYLENYAYSGVSYSNTESFKVDLDKFLSSQFDDKLAGATFDVYQCEVYYAYVDLDKELTMNGNSNSADRTTGAQVISNNYGDSGYYSSIYQTYYYGAAPSSCKDSNGNSNGVGKLVAKGLTGADGKLTNDATIGTAPNQMPNAKNYTFDKRYSYYIKETTPPNGYRLRSDRISLAFVGGSVQVNRLLNITSSQYSALPYINSQYQTMNTLPPECLVDGSSPECLALYNTNAAIIPYDTYTYTPATGSNPDLVTLYIYNISLDIRFTLELQKFAKNSSLNLDGAVFELTSADQYGNILEKGSCSVSSATSETACLAVSGVWTPNADYKQYQAVTGADGVTGKLVISSANSTSGAAENITSGYFLLKETVPPVGGYISGASLLIKLDATLCGSFTAIPNCNIGADSSGNIQIATLQVQNVYYDLSGTVTSLSDPQSYISGIDSNFSINLNTATAYIYVDKNLLTSQNLAGYYEDDKGYRVDLRKIDANDGNRPLSDAHFILWECTDENHSDCRKVDTVITGDRADEPGYATKLSNFVFARSNFYVVQEITPPQGYGLDYSSGDEYPEYYIKYDTDHAVVERSDSEAVINGVWYPGSGEASDATPHQYDNSNEACINQNLELGCYRFDVSNDQLWTIKFPKTSDYKQYPLSGAVFRLCLQRDQKLSLIHI